MGFSLKKTLRKVLDPAGIKEKTSTMGDLGKITDPADLHGYRKDIKKEKASEHQDKIYGTGGYNGWSKDSPPDIARNDPDYAKVMKAWINWSQYEDYKERFLPQEQQLLDDVTGQELLNQRLSGIRTNAKHAQAASKSSAANRLGRYGVKQDAGQKAATDTQQSLSSASSLARAENLTRQHIEDRNMQVIGGGASRQQAIYTGEQ